MPKLIKMTRGEPMHPGGPVSADVHPDEVQNWSAHGWVEAQEQPEPKPVQDMTVKELREYAKVNAIPIPADATSKDAILGVIEAAEVPQG